MSYHLKWPDVDEPTIPITTVLAVLAELLEASAIDVASVSVCGGMGMCGGCVEGLFYNVTSMQLRFYCKIGSNIHILLCQRQYCSK